MLSELYMESIDVYHVNVNQIFTVMVSINGMI